MKLRELFKINNIGLEFLTISLLISILVFFSKSVSSQPADLEWLKSLWPDDFNGELCDEEFGKSVAVGDVNGDAIDDIIVSSHIWIRIYDGGFNESYGWVNPRPILKIGHRHNTYFNKFGDVTVADVNNDGLMDIIFGERCFSTYEAECNVFVFYGNDEWTTSSEPLVLEEHENADWIIASPSGEGEGFGNSMANIGDVNIDGIDDIIIGAPFAENKKGKAYVFYGSSTGLPEDHEPDGIIPPYDMSEITQNGITYRINYYDTYLGAAVARDGHWISSEGYTADNFIIGIPEADIDLDGNGYFSNTEQKIGVALIGPRWWCLSGDNEHHAGFGSVLGNAGDVNGDGHEEVIIYARGFANPQKVFLYLGDEDRINTSERETPYDWSVTGIPYCRPEIGAPCYFCGKPPSIGSVGDVNGDGYDDILIGDCTYNTDGEIGNDGRVHIWFGGAPTLSDPSGLGQNETPDMADIILGPSDITSSYIPDQCVSFGASFAYGDINGDERSDVVVGDPYAFHPDGGTDPGIQSGAVHIFMSNSDNELITLHSPNGGENWKVGNAQTIRWVSTGPTSGLVDIDISTDGGSSWTAIFSDIVDDGSELWPVPNTPSTNCLIRITDNDNIPYDVSDEQFSISYPQVDVWIKDCEEDDGTEPSSTSNCEVWWESPDIWIDLNGDIYADTSVGIRNVIIRALVRNRESDLAHNTKVKFYFKENTTSLIFPQGAKYIGEDIVSIPPNSTALASIIPQNLPPPPSAGYRGCIGVILWHPDDNSQLPFANNGNPPNDNNTACLNINIIPTQAGKPTVLTFNVNSGGESGFGLQPWPRKIILQVDDHMPLGWNWVIDGIKANQPFILKLGEERAAKLKILPAHDADPHSEGFIDVRQVDAVTDKALGGIRFNLYEDHRPPERLRSVEIESFKGKIVLIWDPALKETETGLADQVSYYEILRNGKTVARVSQDLNYLESRMHWIDPDPPKGKLTYSLLVVDEGGNVSERSPEVSVTLPTK